VRQGCCFYLRLLESLKWGLKSARSLILQSDPSGFSSPVAAPAGELRHPCAAGTSVPHGSNQSALDLFCSVYPLQSSLSRFSYIQKTKWCFQEPDLRSPSLRGFPTLDNFIHRQDWGGGVAHLARWDCRIPRCRIRPP
jgi:hypothetical protein